MLYISYSFIKIPYFSTTGVLEASITASIWKTSILILSLKGSTFLKLIGLPSKGLLRAELQEDLDVWGPYLQSVLKQLGDLYIMTSSF